LHVPPFLQGLAAAVPLPPLWQAQPSLPVQVPPLLQGQEPSAHLQPSLQPPVLQVDDASSVEVLLAIAWLLEGDGSSTAQA